VIISYLQVFYLKIINISLKGFFYIALTVFTTVSSNLIANNDPSKPIKPPHYRGLCVLNDSCAWFSGSKGTVIRTTDGGKHFDTISPQSTNTRFAYFLPDGKQTVENYNPVSDAPISLWRKDYRDIWAKNEKEAVIMSAGDSALILKTMDGGKNWTIVYTDFRKDIFLDALEIDSKTGIGMVLGDPINTRKHFAALYTTDFGSSWNNLPIGDWNLPLDTLESFFAASGTSLVIIESKVKAADSCVNCLARTKNLTVGFAGGGINPSYHIVKFKQQTRHTKKQNKRFNLSISQPRVVSNLIIPMPIAGGPGSGVYGMCLSDDGRMIAVGGNYTLPDSFNGASAHSTATNFGLKWSGGIGFQGHTGGYRSGVCISRPIFSEQLQSHPTPARVQTGIHKPNDTTMNSLIKSGNRITFCTGTNGSDISSDNGVTWYSIPKQTLTSGLYFEGSFNACAFSSKHLWVVGNSGKFQRIPISYLLSMGIK
jgi:photosystem II stability/assembly factor-like uncharacterized protein